MDAPRPHDPRAPRAPWFPSAHALAAGAVGGACVLGAELAGPWAPLVDVGGAVAVGAIAAHAVLGIARRRDRDVSALAAIACAARVARRRRVVAEVLALGCRPRAVGAKEVRALGRELVGLGVRRAVGGAVGLGLSAASPHVAACARVVSAARGALESGAFVGEMERAAARFADVESRRRAARSASDVEEGAALRRGAPAAVVVGARVEDAALFERRDHPEDVIEVEVAA